MFVVKWNSNGGLIWGKSYGGEFQDEATSVCVDSNDNIGFGGFGSSTITFDNKQPLDFGNYNMFRAKLDPSGTTQWVLLCSGANGHTDQPNTAKFDSNNDLVLAGICNPNTDLGGGVIGSGSGFVAKYLGSDGSFVWQVVNSKMSSAVADVNSTGDVFVSPTISGPTSFGGTNLSPGGLCLARFTKASGNHVWSECFDDPFTSPNNFTQDLATRIAVGSSGNVFISGGLLSNLVFDDGTSIAAPSFFASFNSLGSHRWSVPISSFQSHANSCSTFGTSSVYCAGSIGDTTNFGGVTAGPSNGGQPMFIGQYNQ